MSDCLNFRLSEFSEFSERLLINFKKTIHLPRTPFNRLLLVWAVFLLANIALSQSIAVSLLSLTPLMPRSGIIAGLPFSPSLPISESWLIALSSIGSSIKNAFFGTGLGNFGNAFTAYHSPSFNSNPLWFWRFNHSVSPLLTVLVEQGLLGVFFWILLFYKSYQSYQSYLSEDQEFFFPAKKRILIKICFFLIFLSALSFFFFPLPLSYFPLISLITPISLVSLGLLLSNFKFQISSLILLIPLSLLIPLLLFFSPKLSPQLQMQIAENSLTAAEKNSNKTQIKTLAIDALKKSTFAISLDPNNSSLRLSHLSILRNLSNLVENSDRLISDEFAAILKLDPNNPKVFLTLARYQFSQGDYFGASQSLKTAINLKADYSPAWYDLAQTYASLAQNAKNIGNKDLEKQNLSLKQISLKETKRLVCEVHYEKNDCEKVTKSFGKL